MNPRTLARRTLSRRVPSAARAPFRRSRLSALGEELLQESSGLCCQYAMYDRRVVIEPGVGTDVVETGGRSTLQVRGAIDDRANSSVQCSSCTHDTRLQGDDQSAIVETPTSESRCSVAQGEYLCVRCRIRLQFTFVVSSRNDTVLVNDNRSDRYVPVLETSTSFDESSVHRIDRALRNAATERPPFERTPLERTHGGRGGIRTHGGLHLTRFPSVPIRPLSHPSSIRSTLPGVVTARRSAAHE